MMCHGAELPTWYQILLIKVLSQTVKLFNLLPLHCLNDMCGTFC